MKETVPANSRTELVRMASELRQGRRAPPRVEHVVMRVAYAPQPFLPVGFR